MPHGSRDPVSTVSADSYAYHVRGICFRYPLSWHASSGEQNRWVIDNLTCDIRPGEFFGIIGPNGSGKSSLLKILSRILRPAQGTVTLFGTDLCRLPQAEVAQTIALVPQESHQVFPFTVAEVVVMGRFPYRRSHWHVGGIGWETAEDINLAQHCMTDMDVLHLAHRSISDLSGGERQRVMIARALTQQPKVMLLDEPTAFLDLSHQLGIGRVLRRLNKERGLTVVLVSHDLNLASQYCDRLMLLNEGGRHRIGPPEDVITSDVLASVYGCEVLVDPHPESSRPRVTLPAH